MSSNKNILVTGANGQLGMEFRELKKRYPRFNFLFVAKEELSITDTDLLDKYFKQNNIYCCINCAAYTAVDKSETDKEAALLVNAEAPAALSSLCKKHGSIFFHFSTDYVFDGKADTPYLETFETNPVNFYGETKLIGEKKVLQNNPEAFIMRTSWVYSSHGKNFVKTMLRLMCEKESIGVVNDQFGCPTYAADLADTVMQLINKNNKANGGIYNYSNEGIISWYDFAIEIKKLIHSKCIVNPINTSAYPTPAKRPHYSALNTDKIQNTFQIQIPHWQKSLSKCIDLLSL
ncbi:MAG: dTDP-4-dehydrorhamnose reductase [Ferruginibacter sp.]